jgi:hypothetical protein
LNVDGHELCGSRAALQEFTVRVARLNNRNTDPEGFNFLREGCRIVPKLAPPRTLATPLPGRFLFCGFPRQTMGIVTKRTCVLTSHFLSRSNGARISWSLERLIQRG